MFKPAVGMNPAMGQMTWGDQLGFHIAPARVESRFPNAFRMAQYPDGSRRIQGAYAWSQGREGGVVWKDLPMVQVDEDGQEVK